MPTQPEAEDLILQIVHDTHRNVEALIQTELQSAEPEKLKVVLISGESSSVVKIIRKKLRNGVAQSAGDRLIYLIAFQILSKSLSDSNEYREYANKMMEQIGRATAYR